MILTIYQVQQPNGGVIEYLQEPQGQQYTIVQREIPEEIIVVPETITAIPFFVQLELMGITESDVINKIETLHQAEILNDQQRVEALVSVRRANIFERNHPFISLIANAFEISQKQVDQIFINGNQL